MTDSPAPPRVLLDTNVWNYLVDHGGIEPMRKAVKVRGICLIACPAVVYECLRTSDRDRRRRLARALTRDTWSRVMPEAFSEAEDFRIEVSRVRPGWLMASPDLRQWRLERSDWLGGFWRRVREDPHMVARHVATVGSERLERAQAETRAARAEAHSRGHTLDNFIWDHNSTFTVPTPGWNGQDFETWRAAALQHWWRDLVLGESRTMNDWLAPWLDLDAIRQDKASWVSFWTQEADTSALPREWIRWAMASTQATRNVTTGTPGDNQLATYLLDVDVFVTTDKAFVALIEAMRPHSPSPLAETRRGPSGADAVGHVLDVLNELA